MNASYGQCSLFLYPQQLADKIQDTSALINGLQKIGFIAGKITGQQKNDYYSGEKFLDYIAYMGCAPLIAFAASDNSDNFCYIKIHRYAAEKLLVSQKQPRPPQCPHCHKTVNNWLGNKTETTITCQQCHTTSNIAKFNWRKMAGYSRLFIEITDIFPKEAIPQQLLLDKLSNLSGTEWQYFYCCQ